MSGNLTESLAHLFVLGCFGEGKSAAFGDGLSFDLASCVEDALIALGMSAPPPLFEHDRTFRRVFWIFNERSLPLRPLA